MAAEGCSPSCGRPSQSLLLARFKPWYMSGIVHWKTSEWLPISLSASLNTLSVGCLHVMNLCVCVCVCDRCLRNGTVSPSHTHLSHTHTHTHTHTHSAATEQPTWMLPLRLCIPSFYLITCLIIDLLISRSFSIFGICLDLIAQPVREGVNLSLNFTILYLFIFSLGVLIP